MVQKLFTAVPLPWQQRLPGFMRAYMHESVWAAWLVLRSERQQTQSRVHLDIKVRERLLASSCLCFRGNM